MARGIRTSERTGDDDQGECFAGMHGHDRTGVLGLGESGDGCCAGSGVCPSCQAQTRRPSSSNDHADCPSCRAHQVRIHRDMLMNRKTRQLNQKPHICRQAPLAVRCLRMGAAYVRSTLALLTFAIIISATVMNGVQGGDVFSTQDLKGPALTQLFGPLAPLVWFEFGDEPGQRQRKRGTTENLGTVGSSLNSRLYNASIEQQGALPVFSFVPPTGLEGKHRQQAGSSEFVHVEPFVWKRLQEDQFSVSLEIGSKRGKPNGKGEDIISILQAGVVVEGFPLGT
eukprot:1161014-Rhodomonas_salina.2